MARQPVKHSRILEDLRWLIVGGDYQPGARLPTRQQLESRYECSSVTIQRVLDALAEDGFVHAQGRNGTYVADRPPHLSRYGIVFFNTPSQDNWTQFHVAAFNEAMALDRSGRVSAPIYFGIDEHRDSPDYARLVDDIESHRLAGLFFPNPPYGLGDSPVVRAPGVARVAVMPEPTLPGFIALDLGGSWMQRALARLQQARRRRVAVVCYSQMVNAIETSFASTLSAFGLETRPHWINGLCLCRSGLAVGRNLVRLLMQSEDRPDALLVTDDNLLEQASAGLVAAGVRVPEDVYVIAHANFPWPTPSAYPVVRLGYDMRMILREAVRVIDVQSRGGTAPSSVTIPALFEEELARPETGATTLSEVYSRTRA